MFSLAYVSLIVTDYLGKFEGQNTEDRKQNTEAHPTNFHSAFP